MTHQLKQYPITACPDASARHLLHPPGKHLQVPIQADFNRETDLAILLCTLPLCTLQSEPRIETVHCTLLYMVLKQLRKICLFNEFIRLFIRQLLVASLKRHVGTAVPEALRGARYDTVGNQRIRVPV